MEWTTIGIGIAWATHVGYKYFFQEKNNDHTKLDKTRSEIITAYETRIQQLEEQHSENESRITALEKEVMKQTEIMEQQKKYIESLVNLVQGRDPAIQAFLKVSEVTLDKFNNQTAPKVDEIHSHIVKGGDVL